MGPGVDVEPEAEGWRCPGCDEVHQEEELVAVHECSSDQCGSTFAAIDGRNCLDCNRPFTRLIHEHGCPSCGGEDECEEITTEKTATEAEARA